MIIGIRIIVSLVLFVAVILQTISRSMKIKNYDKCNDLFAMAYDQKTININNSRKTKTPKPKKIKNKFGTCSRVIYPPICHNKCRLATLS